MKANLLTLIIPALLFSTSVEAGLWGDLKNALGIDKTSKSSAPNERSEEHSQSAYPDDLKARVEQNKVYVTDGNGTVVRIIDNGRFYVKSAQVNPKAGMVCITSMGSGGLSRYSLSSGQIIPEKETAGSIDNIREYSKYYGDISFNINKSKLSVLDSAGRIITVIDNGCFDIESAIYDKSRDVIVVQSSENHKRVAYSFRSGSLTSEDLPTLVAMSDSDMGAHKYKIDGSKVLLLNTDNSIFGVIDNGRFNVSYIRPDFQSRSVCIESVGNGGASVYSIDTGQLMAIESNEGRQFDVDLYYEHRGDAIMEIRGNKLFIKAPSGKIIRTIVNDCHDIKSATYSKRQDAVTIQNFDSKAAVAYSIKTGNKLGHVPFIDAEDSNFSPKIVDTTWTLVGPGDQCYDLNFLADGSLEEAKIKSSSKNKATPSNRSDKKIFSWKLDGDAIRISEHVGGVEQPTTIREGYITESRMEGDIRGSKPQENSYWFAEPTRVGTTCFNRHRSTLSPLKQRELLTAEEINLSKKVKWATSPRSNEYDSAVADIASGNDVSGFRKMIAIANSGDPRAKNYMGIAYETTRRVSGSYEPQRAVDWYSKAAAQGYPEAENRLGTMYHEGKGVQQDYDLAMQWYRFADADGQPNAAYNIGLLYEFGLGVPKDIRKAIDWYNKAETQGDEGATVKLDILDIDNKAKRFAAKKQPSKMDVLGVVLGYFSSLTDRGDIDEPDMLVRTLPIFGETRRVRFTIRDLSCSGVNDSHIIQCSFIANQKDIGGMLTGYSRDYNYTVSFRKGENSWHSDDLKQQIRALGAKEKLYAEAASQSSQNDKRNCMDTGGMTLEEAASAAAFGCIK